MSLPTTSAKPPSQLSIRSFFQPAQPPKLTPQPAPAAPSSSSPSPSATPSAQSHSAAHPPPPPPPPGPSRSAPPRIPAPTSHPTSKPSLSSPPSSSPFPSLTLAPPSDKQTSSVTLPREAAIRPIFPDDIPPLRRLNALLLPVSYNDAFYQHAADPSTGRFSRLITWSSPPSEPPSKPKPPAIVGAIVCRLESQVPITPTASSAAATATAHHASSTSSSSSSSSRSTSTSTSSPATAPLPPPTPTLYIQSLCLLAPYRSLGLATAALDDIITAVAAASLTDPANHHLGGPIRSLTAHVWTQNEDGLRWYEARGFRRVGDPIRGYYLKLRPDSAWLVSRPIGPSALLAAMSNANANANSNPNPHPNPNSCSQAPTPPEGRSYQSLRPDTEWNDLPDDMARGLLPPGRRGASEANSATSSRSSSSARKKRDRSYPVAAFGNS